MSESIEQPVAYVIVCESQTGILLRQVEKQWVRSDRKDGDSLIPFTSIDSARQFMQDVFAADQTIECVLLDSDRAFLESLPRVPPASEPNSYEPIKPNQFEPPKNVSSQQPPVHRSTGWDVESIATPIIALLILTAAIYWVILRMGWIY